MNLEKIFRKISELRKNYEKNSGKFSSSKTFQKFGNTPELLVLQKLNPEINARKIFKSLKNLYIFLEKFLSLKKFFL